ncbi:MAG TPA: hypothetical protein VGK46_07495 [Saprospiraceae bacterium]
MKKLRPIIFLLSILFLFLAIYFLNRPNTDPLVFEEFELMEKEFTGISASPGIAKKWILVSNFEDNSAKMAQIDSFVCTRINSFNPASDSLIEQYQFLFVSKTKNTNPATLKNLSPELVETKVAKDAISKYIFYASGKVQVWLFHNGGLWRIKHDFSCN